MKTPLGTLLLCFAVALFSCKKEIATKKTDSTTPNVHGLGAKLLDKTEYEKLIKSDRPNAKVADINCSAVDMTNQFPPVGDQGLQGSCTGWAVGYYLKSFYEGQEHAWPLNVANHQFSPQFLYSLTHVGTTGDGGGAYLSYVVYEATTLGVCSLQDSPYDPWNEQGWQNYPTDAQFFSAYPFKGSSYSAVPYRSVDEIRAHLCNREPVVIGFPVYDDFMYLDATNDTYDNLNGTLWGNHAVAIIGYDDSRRAFKIVNQWGQFWGANGYGWISYDLIANNDWETYVMYDTPDPLMSQTYSALSGAGISTIGYLSGDFNGDGNSDIIQPWQNGSQLACMVHDITSGSGTYMLENQTDLNAGYGNVGMMAGDWNGDGKCDLIQGWNNGGKLGITVFTSNGSSFNRAYDVTPGQGSGNLKLLPVDLDGDGKTDIAQIWNKNGNIDIFVYRSTGSSYYQVSDFFASGVGVNNVGFFAADWNGDGKTDIIQTWNNGGYLGIIVFQSTGSNYFVAHSGTSPQGQGNIGLVPMDYNGDGKDDFVQAWNNNNVLNFFLYQSSGYNYEVLGNYGTQQYASSLLAMLPVKRAGKKPGVVRVWNNSSWTAFNRYDILTYE